MTTDRGKTIDVKNLKPHRGQGILDNIYLLLILGLGFPFIIYMLWAVLELINLRQSP